jgi:ParB-like chromosome segregation protein Spo0J
MNLKTELTSHPLASIFPPLGTIELGNLAEDIKANGLKEPMWLYEDKILDGNNRYRACLKIGYRFKETDFRQFDAKTQGDPLKFVVSANLHRRHLNESQRAAIAATIVSSKLGYNQYNSKSVTNDQAAKMLGVSEATVKMAKKVAEKAAPEINQMVQEGKLRLGAATKVIKKPKEEQQAELARIAKEREQKQQARQAAKTAKTGGAAKSKTSNVAKANQAIKDLDEFKEKWKGLNEMQRRGFVATFIDELAEIIEHEREQQAMIGAAA